MRATTRAAVVAGLAGSVLVASACGASVGGASTGKDTGGKAGGEITVQGCQPQNTLLGGNTGEQCGHDIVTLTTSMLFRYDPETSQPKNDLAESVETTDNQNFTVKIRQGVTFHDGSALTAKSFVDAWNYTAYAPNKQYLASFMEPIEGYAALQADKGTPTSTAMTGLKVVDDHTFTIKTAEPVSNMPLRLGFTAFAPLPDSFFADPAEAAKKPIGAGPYQLEEYTPNQRVVLKKFNDYGGAAEKGNVDQITFRIYKDSGAAYNDLLANNLDVTVEIPAGSLIDKTYEQELDGRFINGPFPAVQTIMMPPTSVAPEYAKPELRKAISMAIDRDKVTKDQFAGTRVPADGWVAPGVEGFQAGACGEDCRYDPAKAKAMLAKAGGFNGKLAIGYNADASHKSWVEATCNSIRQALDVDCIGAPTSDFAAFRDAIGKHELTYMFRSAWTADYPHIENFLTPQYSKGAASNDTEYDNPAFDAKLAAAAKATGADSLKLYQDAEKMLDVDMPSIPLWYYQVNIGYSTKVTNVQLNRTDGRADLLSIKTR
ncbi:MAG: ABC transporter substrate-binding protein [Dermatophilaceae bacterium]